MKKLFSPRLWWLDVVLLLGLALLLGIYGGASTYHPDSVLERGLRTLAQGGNPNFFNYPALVLYLDGYAFHGWLALLHATGQVHGAAAPLDWYLAVARPGSGIDLPLLAPGHAVTLFFSLLGVAATYLAAYRLTRRRAIALAAGLLLATCLLWANDAHYLTVDTPMTALGMTTIALALHVTARPGEPPRELRAWQVIVLGVLGGLTAAAKYNGALVLLAPAAASFFQYKDKWRWSAAMLLMGAAAAVAFFATNPFILQDSTRFWKDFLYELDHSANGHAGFTTTNAWLYHLRTSLPLAFGVPALILAGMGAVWLLLTRSLRWGQKLGLLIYPLAQAWVVGSSHLSFQRYTLPLLPVIAILAALALGAFITFVGRRSARLGAAACLPAGLVLFALIFPNLQAALRSDELLARGDTRDTFSAMLLETGLDNPRLAGFAGMYTERFFNYRLKGTQGAANQASFLVVDSFSHDRWFYDLNTRLTIPRSDLDGYRLIQLSPYTCPKEQVALAPQSIYSPYRPDLYDRRLAGPFIEIYLRDQALAARLMTACQNAGGGCLALEAQQGYYFQQLMQ